MQLSECRVGMRIRNTHYAQNGIGTITRVFPDHLEINWDVMGLVLHPREALDYFGVIPEPPPPPPPPPRIIGPTAWEHILGDES